ncbi:MAG: diguanylate phosphodiesterase [Deltaproteobacteria bacterium]|nr:diguanylate phosphodiesterase [Deltaproteobacteria bacterium]
MSAKKADETAHREDFLVLFRRGLKFTEELLAENEKLRYRLANLENELDGARRGGGDDSTLRELREKVRELEIEKARLLSSYTEVESANRDYQTRYAEIEEEHNNLANLYIASYQLHSTMCFKDVVQVINEIVINLVGVSSFTMYLLDVPSGVLHPIAGEGVDLAHAPRPRLGEGVIGKALAGRQRHVAESLTTAPLAVVPLATADSQVGAIVIDRLLVQKEGFTAVDNELFNLLSVHAATALLAGLLRDQVGDRGAIQAITVAHARSLLG